MVVYKPAKPLYYDEIEVRDMEFVKDEKGAFFEYPCPCGDVFRISLEDMINDDEDVARCDTCGIIIKVIYTQDDLSVFSAKDEAPIPAAPISVSA